MVLHVRYRGPAARLMVGDTLLERDVVTRISQADFDAIGRKAERVEIIPEVVIKPKARRRVRRTQKES